MALMRFATAAVCFLVAILAVSTVGNSYPDGSGVCIVIPNASVAGFRVDRDLASWIVYSEIGTEAYIIEGCSAPNSPGEELIRVPPGLGERTVHIGKAYPWYRLVELEVWGNRSVLEMFRFGPRSRVVPGGRPVSTSSSEEPRSGSMRVPSARQYRPSSTSASIDCAILTESQYASSADLVASDFTMMGYTVDVFPDLDGAARTDVAADIADLAATRGARYFLILGDENTLPCAEYPSFNSKFMRPSDQELADTDQDGIPDVIVTRWPVKSSSEIMLSAAERFWWYNLFQATGGGSGTFGTWSGAYDKPVLFLTGDTDSGQPVGSGDLTKTLALDVAADIQSYVPNQQIEYLYETAYPDPSDRNVATADIMNAANPGLVVMLATRSGRYFPARYFYSATGDEPTPWTMELQGPYNQPPVIISLSCDAGNSTGTFPGSLGATTPICSEFLRSSLVDASTGSGAIAWVGMYEDSDQEPNHLLTKLFVEELYSRPYRSMAVSWYEALTRAYASYGPTANQISTLNTAVFLGDPLSTFRVPQDVSVDCSIRRRDGTMVSMFGQTAVGCPQGDQDQIVVSVEIAESEVSAPLDSCDITLVPLSGAPQVFYSSACADSAPVSVGGYLRTTITVSAFGGCGYGVAAVKIDDAVLDFVGLNTKTFDININGTSAGIVDLPDLAEFTFHFTSSPCDCVFPKLYDDCVNYVGASPDTTVALEDFSFFSAHYAHSYAAGGSPVSTNVSTSTGSVALGFREDDPLIGQRKLFVEVALPAVEEFSVLFISLLQQNPHLEFAGWTQEASYAPTTMSAEVVRDGQEQVVIAALGERRAGFSDVVLGTLEFLVHTDDPINVESQLPLVLGDIQTTSGAELSFSSERVGRVSQPSTYIDELAQNYPNPFNPSTMIAYSLTKRSDVTLRIFNVRGQLVKTLVDRNVEAGGHRVLWDGRNNSGKPIASGVYFYRITASAFQQTRKMVLLR